MREERFVGTEEIDALWSALDARLTGLVCRAWTCTDVAMRERHTHERDPLSGIHRDAHWTNDPRAGPTAIAVVVAKVSADSYRARPAAPRRRRVVSDFKRAKPDGERPADARPVMPIQRQQVLPHHCNWPQRRSRRQRRLPRQQRDSERHCREQ